MAGDDNDGISDSSATTGRTGNQSYTSKDLVGTLLIQRIVGFLDQGPSDFAITLLPDAEPSMVETKEEEVTNAEEGEANPHQALSSDERSLLQTSTVLMQEPTCDDSAKRGGHLGLDARHLPRIARIIRKAYFQAKATLRTASSSSSSSSSPSTPPWQETEELFRVTSCLLLIQPDHATAWADRRRCLLSFQYLDVEPANRLAPASETNGEGDNGSKHDQEARASSLLWNKEMEYLDLLVTQHSKAPSYWAHRKYVLRQLMQDIQKSDQCRGVLDRANKTKHNLFLREVKTCTDVAEKFPKNYYAWTHRRYLWDKIFREDRVDVGNAENKGFCVENEREWEDQLQERKMYRQLLETELWVRMLQEWLPRHPADHSAVHYSCQILDLLLKATITQEFGDQREQQANIESICKAALEKVRSLLSKYSCENYESLWILRRLTCKILWKNIFCTCMAETGTATTVLLTKRKGLASRLVKEDLVRTLSSSLGMNIQSLQQLGQDGAIQDDPREQKNDNIHAWTFLAWCLENLDGIDNDHVDDDTKFFTPWLRETIWRHITLSRPTGSKQHNALMYTSPSSPFSEILTRANATIT